MTAPNPALSASGKATHSAQKPSIIIPQPAKRQQLISFVHCCALCLTSIITGLNDIPPLALFNPTSPQNNSPLLHITCTALPFALGSILAAAFLEPIIRASRLRPFSLFILANLLTASAHAPLLIPHISWNQTVPCVVVGQLLTGISNTTVATIAILQWCKAKGGRMPGAIMHGMMALGVTLQTALAGTDTGIITAGEGRQQGYHLAVLILALLNAALLHAASRSSEPVRAHHDEEGNEHDTESQPTSPSASVPLLKTHPLPSRSTPNQHYPSMLPLPGAAAATAAATPSPLKPPPDQPPANQTTVLIALFALTHFAALTVLPAWLVVVSVSATTVQDAVHHHTGDDSASPRLGHTTAVTAALWAGIVVGRLAGAVLFPSFPLSVSSSSLSSSSSSSSSSPSWRGGGGRGGRLSGKVVGSSLVSVAGFLLVLVWLFSRDTVASGMGVTAAAAAAALVGVVLGPVYPWAVAGMLGRGMGEEETASGVGITVAFGNVGMVAALFVTGSIELLEAPGALQWVMAGLFGGMLLCWDALPDE